MRRYLRHERDAADWFVAHGVPVAPTTLALWGFRLALLGMLIYVAFWLAMLTAFAIAVASGAPNIDWGDDDDDVPEWRHGHSGFGLYDKKEWRHDPGGFDER